MKKKSQIRKGFLLCNQVHAALLFNCVSQIPKTARLHILLTLPPVPSIKIPHPPPQSRKLISYSLGVAPPPINKRVIFVNVFEICLGFRSQTPRGEKRKLGKKRKDFAGLRVLLWEDILGWSWGVGGRGGGLGGKG